MLVQRGVLTQEQLEAILSRQAETDQPFGAVALELCGISEQELWQACDQQAAGFLPHVELACEPNDPRALQALPADQAWRMSALPLRYEKENLVIAITAERVQQTTRDLRERFGENVQFVIADQPQIEVYIRRRYDYSPAATADTVTVN